MLLIKKITPSSIEDILNDIVTGKIDNWYDAKQEYLKKIQSDEDLLRSTKYGHRSKTWKLIDIIDKTKYTVFGITPLSEDKPLETRDEQSAVIDMPELKTEQQGQALKLLTPEQMLSRLPISLAQLEAGNNLKMK